VTAVQEPETPTITETALPGSGAVLLEDSFDILSADWTEPQWVTSYAPNISKSKMGLEDGWLLFDLIDRSSMLYTFNKKLVEKNVVIETISQISCLPREQ
jgi:hypothetical protein